MFGDSSNVFPKQFRHIRLAGPKRLMNSIKVEGYFCSLTIKFNELKI